MTYLLAAAILISIPVFAVLFGQNRRYRLWGFTGLTLIPFVPGLPVLGYLYGWPLWKGISLGFSVSLVDALVIALLVTRRDYRKHALFWPFFLLYALSLFLSIFGSLNMTATAFVWWQFARMLLLFAVVAGEAHRPEVRNSMFMGMALGLIYQVTLVVPQKLGGVVQAFGSFASKNLLGMMVELSVLVLIGVILAGQRNKLYYLGVASGLICVAASGSRAGMAFVGAGAIALFIASLARRPTPAKMKAVGVAIVALLIAGQFAIATLNDRFGGGAYVTDESGRETLEAAAIAMADNHPFGVGANMYVWNSIHEGYADQVGMSWMPNIRFKPVHNSYLLARAETGWLGEISFILMIFVPMVYAFRTAFYDRRSPTGELALGCAFALLANLIHNNWEFDTHSAAVQYLMFAIFGMISAMWKDRHSAASPSAAAWAEDPAKLPEKKKQLVY